MVKGENGEWGVVSRRREEHGRGGSENNCELLTATLPTAS